METPPLPVPVKEDPGDDAARLKEFRKRLPETDERLRPEHDFPIYERLLYKTLDELIDGHHWKFSFDNPRKPAKMFGTGTRTAYAIHQPIVDKKTGELIHNFYPTRPAGPAQRMFDDDDRRFYVRV